MNHPTALQPPAAGSEASAARPRRGTLARRIVTIPRTFLLFAVVTLALPALAAAAIVIDVARLARRGRPPTGLRLVAFLWCYLASEVVGLTALFGLWLFAGVRADSRRRRLLDGTYAIQHAWTSFLLASLRVLFRLRFEVEGAACTAPGPILVFIRHSSAADTILPTALLGGKGGLRLRFVLKRELLQDPCLDVAGHWIPNHFVDRRAKDGAEIEAIRELTRDLGPRDGVLIYPEGTRFTEERRRAALGRLASGDPAVLAAAERLLHVLPPRLGGPLALLDGHTPADVVFFAHHGMDGAATIGDVWRGALVGRSVRVRLWRVPRAEIPESNAARVAWLHEQWAALDAWIGEVGG